MKFASVIQIGIDIHNTISYNETSTSTIHFKSFVLTSSHSKFIALPVFTTLHLMGLLLFSDITNNLGEFECHQNNTKTNYDVEQEGSWFSVWDTSTVK